MDVILLVETKILSVAEKILGFLEGNCDYRTFEAELKKELDNLGCEILKEVKLWIRSIAKAKKGNVTGRLCGVMTRRRY